MKTVCMKETGKVADLGHSHFLELGILERHRRLLSCPTLPANYITCDSASLGHPATSHTKSNSICTHFTPVPYALFWSSVLGRAQRDFQKLVCCTLSFTPAQPCVFVETWQTKTTPLTSPCNLAARRDVLVQTKRRKHYVRLLSSCCRAQQQLENSRASDAINLAFSWNCHWKAQRSVAPLVRP